jgi:hypothetical protein
VSLEPPLVGTVVFATRWNERFTLADTASIGGSFALTLFVVVLFLQPTPLASFDSVVVRYRGSVGDERIQLKWFVTAALFVLLTFTATLVTNLPVAQISFDLALVFLYVAIGVASLKHRLYDIDVIISKAVVYGILGAFITVATWRSSWWSARSSARRSSSRWWRRRSSRSRSNRRAIARSGPRTA